MMPTSEERMRIERDLALAQGRDIQKQFHAEAVKVKELTAKVETLYARLQQTECPQCHGRVIGAILEERDRAVEVKNSAQAQAEHFFQEIQKLETRVSRLLGTLYCPECKQRGVHEESCSQRAK